LAVEVDEFGHAKALRLRRPDGSTLELEARTILAAAGTQPNTVIASEEPDWLKLDGKYFEAVDAEGTPVRPEQVCKPTETQVLTARFRDGRFVSFFGDLHPGFAGNVVKAMASASRGSRVVSQTLTSRAPTPVDASSLAAAMKGDLHARVHHVERLTPTIVEVVVHAPRAARRFRPGQFFRLQNFEAHARRIGSTMMTMEGLALTGASVDTERGLVSLIVLEMGGSSSLCRTL